ncbi:sigma-54-dependent transcriptional regulator [Nannocystis bainbridge]|uniref:Sigma-54 dependent transcriptional regulator n=1 Tax=Nannocystis bainbridge TaxID=2995303 RepID=A0ABT5DWR4_9BACT|nr:sigma-54 dependent transcriptional regulator [Nannocystis bainbridge]MDC0718073.1 sigma-54 dependent transcriptional regulator [Nannocystis bainbridge]
MSAAQIAVVDDEPRMAEILAMLLRRDGHKVDVFAGAEPFLRALAEQSYDLLLTDLMMPGVDGLELLRRARAVSPDMPVVLVTAHASVPTAVAAIRDGAFDFVEKPFDNDACRALVHRALQVRALTRENRRLRAALQRAGSPDIITYSPAMREVLDLAARAARSRATALVTGESGTGKELVARTIHDHSDRALGPFVAVNCKAFAAGVLESELFGHEKGAYTGAAGARAGVFERAGGGTLFLDEIGEVDVDFQAKLLRALQTREVLPVGGTRARPVDVRIVAATNRDLRAECAAGRFREDLYFRLAVIPIRLPPLRERPEDVLPLANHFLARFAAELGREFVGFHPTVETWLKGHPWPGNVRELENLVERAAVLARAEVITRDDLLLEASAPPPASADPDDALPLQVHLDRAAARRIRLALARAQGRRNDAAAELGVERTTLYRLIKKFGLDDD